MSTLMIFTANEQLMAGVDFRTFTFGTGVPIEPAWSSKLMMAMGITLSVVVLACAGGAAACCYRKYKRSRYGLRFNTF